MEQGKQENQKSITGYGWNSEFLTRDGVPWFPSMGEFHYSRYEESLWEKELRKIRGGGIQIVSSYVIWIHHEEREGCFRTDGNRNLRKFIELAAGEGLKVFLRIGPWIHGEVRNGGFPDWFLKKEFVPRTNDRRYLELVEAFYENIAGITKGLRYQDAGPVIGIQIENEYHGACGMSMEEQEEHMKLLTAIAADKGLTAPYMTATGWGGAATGGLLPVMGGYCEAPWDPRTCEIEASVNYLFTGERDDGNIGKDLAPEEKVTQASGDFPFLTAELGGGVQVTKHRRPVVTGKDIGAMSLAKLGCGANLLGYYMYHGGTNPYGELSTMQESKETGYPNDLPLRSYDFMAPLGEYGQVRESFYEIRRLCMFLEDFGSGLCRMKPEFPAENPSDPEDVDGIRFCQRSDGEGGYLFFNQYQRRRTLKAHPQWAAVALTDRKKYFFPLLELPDGEYGYYPFGMKIGNKRLHSASAIPLCILENPKQTYVFYGNGKSEYRWEKEKKSPDAGCTNTDHDQRPDAEILTLTGGESLRAAKLKLDQEYLVIADGLMAVKDELIYWYELPEDGKTPVFRAYPPLLRVPAQLEEIQQEDGWGWYELKAAAFAQDIRLRIYYEGESAECFYQEKLLADHFYNGDCWEIGNLNGIAAEELSIRVKPFEPGQEVFLETKHPAAGRHIVLSKELVSYCEYRFQWTGDCRCGETHSQESV